MGRMNFRKLAYTIKHFYKSEQYYTVLLTILEIIIVAMIVFFLYLFMN